MKRIFEENILAYSFSKILTPNIVTTKVFDSNSTWGQENLNKIAAFLNVKTENLVFPEQKHTRNVGIVTLENIDDSFLNTDALITNVPGMAIGVVTADCVPILLYDSKTKAVGAIHAGWRGTNARIAEKTICAMEENFGTKPENLVAGIGPSISPQVYEVGPDVFDNFADAGHQTNLLFEKQPNSKFLLNLWKANYIQLSDMGLPDISIEQSKMCTFRFHNDFYSARRDGGETGRNAAVIKNEK